MELCWHTPAGEIPLVCFAERVPESDGLPSVVVLSFFDVSRVRRLERQLREATAQSDDLVSLVGHEVRTPLTALKLHTQSLVRQHPQAAGLAAIERATARMEAFAMQIFDYARIRALGVTLHPREMSLRSVVDEVIANFQKQEPQIDVVTRGDARGRWDRGQLMRVVANLVQNALRFGTGSEVTIEARDRGDRASLVVSDHGVGVDPADHERIFEPYERAVSSRNFGGLGLGLWVARQIVLAMSGTITVESQPGDGATFTVDLPKG
jgi:signal transduction histidine kinase